MKKPDVQSNLEANQLASFRKEAKSGNPLLDYSGIVAVLCDVADTAVGGMDCYCTFGLSRDRSTILLTVTIGGSKLYAGGATMKEVSAAAEGLL